MLNETYQLYNALKAAKIDCGNLHPSIKIISSGNVFIVELNDKGHPIQIEYADPKTRPLWKCMPNNQNNFPSLKFSALLDVSDEIKDTLKDKKEQTKAKIQVLTALAKDGVISSKSLKNVEGWKYPKLLSEEYSNKLSKTEPLFLLLDRIEKFRSQPEESLRRLLALLANACKRGTIQEIDNVVELLSGKESTILFNVSPTFLNTKGQERLSKLLSATADKNDETGDDKSSILDNKCCAFTGKQGKIVQGIYPQVNLPVFKQQTALLAMNKDAPCHFRYGNIGAAVFPMSEELATECVNALRYVTDETRRKKTWRAIAGEIPKKWDLLIIYLKEDPGCDISCTDIVTGRDEEDDEEVTDNSTSTAISENDYVTTCEQVCKALKLLIKNSSTPNPNLRCFVIREIDPGRRQVVLSDSFTVNHVFESAKKWKNAIENLPKIQYFVPVGKGVPAKLRSVKAPSPERTVKILQGQWVDNGQRKIAVSGFPLSDVLDLFLCRNRCKKIAALMLERLLRNNAVMLTLIGDLQHSYQLRKSGADANQKRSALDVLALIAILLSHLTPDSFKEKKYMSEMGYNLGRFLALADNLHCMYCISVRGGDVPPKLVGSAFFPNISTNPVKGFKELSERIRVYLDWAKKSANSKDKEKETDKDKKQEKEKEGGLARWNIIELGKVSKQLIETGLTDQRLSDTEQAYMLLGYLAPLAEKKEGAVKNTENNPQ